MKGWMALGLVAIAAAAAWVWKQEADVDTLANRLIDGLPSRLAQWGRELARAANNTAPVAVDPLSWALFGAAVMDRESGGGTQLTPRGPTGTGDGGHGLGLMQLDDRAHPGLIDHPEQWGAAAWNIQRGMRELHDLYVQLDSSIGNDEKLQRTADAYNAGPRALAHADPDSLTTGKDYGTDVLRRAAGFAETVA